MYNAGSISREVFSGPGGPNRMKLNFTRGLPADMEGDTVIRWIEADLLLLLPGKTKIILPAHSLKSWTFRFQEFRLMFAGGYLA